MHPGQRLLIVGIVTIGLALSACSHKKHKPTACVAPASWFEGSPKPADFTDFTTSSTNCQFHRWAWQEFLYLVTPDANGKRPFESLARPTDLFVTSGEPGAYPGATPGARHALQPRQLKLDDAITQAGGGVLFDQQRQVVYYEARVNDVYYDFIRDAKYYDPAHIARAPADASFPVGSLEIKISWRLAEAGGTVYIENAGERFITSETLIAPVTGYDETTKQYVVDDANPVNATVALVGMHVVGRVNLHPEFIWSTFEHVDNAPALVRTPTDAAGPTGPWSFYQPGTPCKSGECNQRPKSVPPRPPYPATQVARVHPQGGGDMANVANIKSLNASVYSQVSGLAKNLELGGGLWTNNGALPPTAGNQRGSLELANSTLETFFQGPPPPTATALNCFDCHNEQRPFGVKDPNWPQPRAINFSHLLELATRYQP